MSGASDIVHVVLSDGEATFRLDALLWGEPGDPDDHLLLSVEIDDGRAPWRSRATSVIAPSVASLADAAAEAGAGRESIGAIDYADPQRGTCLAFFFRLLPDGRVQIAVVVDGELAADKPVHPHGRPDQVLLRVRPEELAAFADALEAIALKDPVHFAWAG